MNLLVLTAYSLWNRRLAALLALLSIALSVSLLLGVERIRAEARASFTNTLSGTDLVVGARSGPLPLLLYSVFHVGNATNNIRWSSFEAVAKHPSVDWAVPISLGDSHRGFRVVGTRASFFDHYRHGRKVPLRFADGRAFGDIFEVVVGAKVARDEGYGLGDQLILTHGAGRAGLHDHDDKPFRITGILKPTGTPVDRSLYVSLESIQAIHLDYQSGAPIPGLNIRPDQVRKFDLAPKEITAMLVGLKSKAATFRVQRWVNTFTGEPLLAILPGATLQELWQLTAVAENALLAVSAMVVLVGLLGMVTVILNSLNDRRRELAILRSVGARPWQVFVLLSSEAFVLALAGVVVGVLLLNGLILALAPYIASHWGLVLSLSAPGTTELTLLGLVLGVALLISLVPGYRAYRYSLADGLTIRL